MNADRQPDGWRRRRDRAHPAYTAAEIVSRDPALAAQARKLQLQLSRTYHAWKTGEWDDQYIPETIPPFLTKLMDGVVIRSCYEIQIDGGAFELVSPIFKIDPRLNYRLSAEMSCRNLDSHAATVELHIFRSNGNIVDVFSSPNLSGSRDWHLAQSQLIELLPSSEPLHGEVHIRVRPQRGGPGSGKVSIDNIEVTELPRVTMESDVPFNVVSSGVPFHIAFHVIGQNPPMETATFSLIDIEDRIVTQESVPLDRSELNRDTDSRMVSLNSSIPRSQGRAASSSVARYHGWTSTRANYRCSVEQPGFYRIRMQLSDQVSAEMPLSVLDGSTIQRSQFGWSLRDLDVALNSPSLVELIHRMGVGLIKLPIWVDYREAAKLDALNKLIARFRSENITTIGVMDRPLGAIDGTLKEDFEKLHPAATLSDSRIWYDSVEPVLTNLGMKLNWLQIGDDTDHSTIGNAAFPKQIESVRNQIHAIGQDIKIGIGWDWRKSIEPSSGKAQLSPVAWQAIHLTSQPKLTEEELLQQAKSWKATGARIWTSIIPLPVTGNSLDRRVLDLVKQIISLRKSEVNAAFISHLSDDEYGLLDTNQKTSPLLLPWTYLTDATAARQYMGSILLTNQSHNHFFDGEDGTVAILWSDHPVTEELFLGSDIQVKDIWGRPVSTTTVALPSGSIASHLPIGPWPLIVRNIDKSLVQWQQQFVLNSMQVSSQIGERGSLPITLQNTMHSQTEVSITVLANTLFHEGSVTQTVTMPAGGIQELGLSYEFLPDASAGNHPVEFAFQLQGDKEHRFSIRRDVKLGHQDIELHWTLQRLNPEIVELQVQVINNTAAPVSFDCKMFPRGTAYQRIMIVDAEKGTTLHKRTVALSQDKISGDSPLWIRCEHVGTNLVLNYRLTE